MRGAHRGRSAILAVVMCLITACAALPEPVEVESSPPGPVVTATQADRIADDAAAVLTRLDTAGGWDQTVAATRLAGPALLWAVAANTSAQPNPISAATVEGPRDVLVAPVVSGWPRAFATVTQGDGGDGSARIAVYTNDSARTPYRLWAVMAVLDGEVVGPFPPATDGAVALTVPSSAPSTAPSASPRPLPDVVAQLPQRYLDVLTLGDASVYAPEFAADGFAAALAERTAAETDRLTSVATTTVSHEVVVDDQGREVAMAALTATGDALVMVAFRTTLTSTVRAGRGVIGVPTEFVAAVGVEQVSGTLTTESVAALAFVVPAERGNIRVVAVADGVAEVRVS